MTTHTRLVLIVPDAAVGIFIRLAELYSATLDDLKVIPPHPEAKPRSKPKGVKRRSPKSAAIRKLLNVRGQMVADEIIAELPHDDPRLVRKQLSNLVFRKVVVHEGEYYWLAA